MKPGSAPRGQEGDRPEQERDDDGAQSETERQDHHLDKEGNFWVALQARWGAAGVPYKHAAGQLGCPASSLGCIWGALQTRWGAAGVPWKHAAVQLGVACKHAGVQPGCPASTPGCPWARKSERVLRKSTVFAKSDDSCTKGNGFTGKVTEPWALCVGAGHPGKRSRAFKGGSRCHLRAY